MTTTALRKKIQNCVFTINNYEVLEAVYTILNSHTQKNNFELSAKDIEIIEMRKNAVKKGKEKTYTVAQVKKKILTNLNK